MENNKTEKITWTPIKVKLGELKAWADNPRLSTKKQAKKLLQSFDEFGQVQTIAVSPDLEVYDGHQRLSALMTIHGKEYEIDARQSSRALTDGERRKLVIYLHTSAVGSWDWDALANWDAGEIIGWGMDSDALKEWKQDVSALTGLLEAEKPPVEDAEPQIDKAEELRQKWGVETGQLWQLGEHRLLCGDCTKREDVERVMGGEKALVLADPPYGVNIVKNNSVGGGNLAAVGFYSPVIGDETTKTAEEFYNTCLSIGLNDFVIWGGNYFSEFLSPKACWVIWDKRGDIPSNNFADCEMAWTSKDSPARLYKQVWMGMVKEGEHGKRVHPTQKPVGLMEFCISLFDSPVVYDGFLGSGTTMVACQNLNRKCRAIEISPAYCAVILERMSTAFPELEIKLQ